MRRAGYDLSGIGSMVVDSVYRVPRLIGPDEKLTLQPLSNSAGSVLHERLVGGVALNHLGWARLFGLEVAVFGKQPDDENGRFLRRGMARLGIEPALEIAGSASSFAQVYVDPAGNRSIYMAPGATAEVTADEIEQHHRAVIEGSATVTTEVSQLPLAAARRVLELARAAGAYTVLDVDLARADAVPTLGSEADFDGLLGSAQLIKASRAALAGWVDDGDGDEAAARLASRYGAEAVLVTLGADGVLAWCDGQSERIASAEAQVVDTTGAGDAFLGGVLAGRQLGLAWPDVLRLGSACGGCCCEQTGGFPQAPEAARARALELYQQLGGSELALPPVPGPSAAAAALEHFLSVAPEQLQRVAERLDRRTLDRCVSLVLGAEEKGARVQVTGIGKSEQVARYAAGLLSSTGTAATFLDGTEALHGGIGQLRADDVVILISNSGETPEILRCCEALRGIGARLIAVTGRLDSSLSRAAELVLECGVSDEGGPLGLAPRASVLAQVLAVAAFSVALQAGKRFSREAYHQRHPAGVLGQRSGSER